MGGEQVLVGMATKKGKGGGDYLEKGLNHNWPKAAD